MLSLLVMINFLPIDIECCNTFANQGCRPMLEYVLFHHDEEPLDIVRIVHDYLDTVFLDKSPQQGINLNSGFSRPHVVTVKQTYLII